MSAPEPPRVSVVLATYNWTSVLRLAVETVLRQTFGAFELLVIGDACTDETGDWVVGLRDPRVQWHNLPENTGNQAGPNNLGLEIARGEFIAYMHQDDLWLPDHLERLVGALAPSRFDLAHTLSFVVSPEPEEYCVPVGLPGTGHYGPEQVAIFAVNLLHRTEAARAIGGWGDWRKLRVAPVEDFITRMIGPRQEFLTVPHVTAVKFHSGTRRNSYVDKSAAQQQRCFDRIASNPDRFRYEQLLWAAQCRARGYRERYLIGATPPDAPPGWFVEQLNRVRGLTPGEVFGPTAGRRRIRDLARDLIPRTVRKPVGGLMRRAGAFLERG